MLELPGLLQNASIMVTGGAGFIGSNLAEILSSDPTNTVTIVDDLTLGKRGKLAWMAGRENCTFQRADVRGLETMIGLAEGQEVILHQAGIPGIQASIDDPVLTNSVNVGGTLSCLEAARRRDVEAFVLASSCAVYGDSAQPPVAEDAPKEPISPYGASKLAAEGYCRVFARLHGLRAVVLRYFNVYGPRQDPRSEYAAVIPKFIDLMLAGRSPAIYGDGEQTRDFIHVADVARANCMAASSEISSGRAYNVGSGRPATINELVDVLNGEMETDLAAMHEAPKPGDIRQSWADTGRAKDELGFEPVYTLRRGLAQTLAHFRSDR
jgi:UDP-glucose 4-epimerase